MSNRPVPPMRDMFRVFRSMPTRWRDNDTYGHVNNVVYYEYFDTAVNGFLMEATAADTRKLSAIGVVVETSCTFFESVSFPALLDIGLAVSRVGESSIQYRLGVFEAGVMRAVAEGRFVHVYVDAQSRKTVPLPAMIREAVVLLA